MRALVLMLTGLWLAAACVPDPPPAATPSPFWELSPVPAETLTNPTSLASPAATASPTATPLPTITPSPTATAAPTLTPTVSSPVGLSLQPLASLPSPPELDLYDLGARLLGREILPPGPLESAPEVGHQRTFWALDILQEEVFRLPATLRARSLHALFYVQDGLSLDLEVLQRSVETWEEQIRPRVADVVGGHWLPDQPTILYGQIPQVAGYYSYTDEYSPFLFPFTNEQTMVYINAEAVPIGSPQYFSTLAHELQHAAHWRADPSEETWLNEGLSEIASMAAGYPSAFIPYFLVQPDISLIHWPEEPDATLPHYGAATLFLTYLREHYLSQGTLQQLVAEPADGIWSVQALLDSVVPGLTFRDLFQEWVVANYLDSRGRPGLYPGRDVQIQPGLTLAGTATVSATVNQYAADYIELRPASGEVRVTFRGQGTMPLLPVPLPPGRAFWWSNRGDAIDSTLTRAFDLRGVDSATLEMEVWFDIEEFWDYAYVEASADGGRTWTVLEGAHTRPENPVGQALGSGYSGRSGFAGEATWVQESIDLSAFAGRRVLVRLEYVTDGAVSLDGLALRRVALPEIGYLWEGEGDGGWVADGFLLTLNSVRQGYWVKVIEFFQDGEIQVTDLPLDRGMVGEVTLKGFGSRLEAAVFVVMAAAPGTSQPAPYTLAVQNTLGFNSLPNS